MTRKILDFGREWWMEILLSALLIVAAGSVFVLVLQSLSAPATSVCWNARNVTQLCIDHRIDQCLETERYTFDQCVELVSQ